MNKMSRNPLNAEKLMSQDSQDDFERAFWAISQSVHRKQESQTCSTKLGNPQTLTSLLE